MRMHRNMPRSDCTMHVHFALADTDDDSDSNAYVLADKSSVIDDARKHVGGSDACSDVFAHAERIHASNNERISFHESDTKCNDDSDPSCAQVCIRCTCRGHRAWIPGGRLRQFVLFMLFHLVLVGNGDATPNGSRCRGGQKFGHRATNYASHLSCGITHGGCKQLLVLVRIFRQRDFRDARAYSARTKDDRNARAYASEDERDDGEHLV